MSSDKVHLQVKGKKKKATGDAPATAAIEKAAPADAAPAAAVVEKKAAPKASVEDAEE